MKQTTTILTIAISSLAIFFSGCGSSTTSDTTIQTVNGNVAAGAPWSSGVISLRSMASANSREIKTKINRDGSYSVNVTGVDGPYILKARSTDGARQLFSYANSSGRANVNPISSVLVKAATNRDPSAVFNTPNSFRANLNSRIQTARDKLNGALKELLRAHNVPENFDPITDQFEANHTGFDSLLDAVEVELPTAGPIRIKSKANDQELVSLPAVDPTSLANVNLTPVSTAAATVTTAFVSNVIDIEKAVGSFVNLFAQKAAGQTVATSQFTSFFETGTFSGFTPEGLVDYLLSNSSMIANTGTVSSSVLTGTTYLVDFDWINSDNSVLAGGLSRKANNPTWMKKIGNSWKFVPNNRRAAVHASVNYHKTLSSTGTIMGTTNISMSVVAMNRTSADVLTGMDLRNPTILVNNPTSGISSNQTTAGWERFQSSISSFNITPSTDSSLETFLVTLTYNDTNKNESLNVQIPRPHLANSTSFPSLTFSSLTTAIFAGSSLSFSYAAPADFVPSMMGASAYVSFIGGGSTSLGSLNLAINGSSGSFSLSNIPSGQVVAGGSVYLYAKTPNGAEQYEIAQTFSPVVNTPSTDTGSGTSGGSLPSALASKMLTFTFSAAQAGAPYSNGDVETFTFSGSGMLFIGNPGTVFAQSFTVEGSEYIWTHATNGQSIRVSLQNDAINEANLNINGNFAGQFTPNTSSSNGGSSNNSASSSTISTVSDFLGKSISYVFSHESEGSPHTNGDTGNFVFSSQGALTLNGTSIGSSFTTTDNGESYLWGSLTTGTAYKARVMPFSPIIYTYVNGVDKGFFTPTAP